MRVTRAETSEAKWSQIPALATWRNTVIATIPSSEPARIDKTTSGRMFARRVGSKVVAMIVGCAGRADWEFTNSSNDWASARRALHLSMALTQKGREHA